MNEELVLLNFLKSGFSTRKLDTLLGFSGTRGWKSWEVIKKYNLKKEDKGKLFLYSETQSKKMIKSLKEDKTVLDDLIKQSPPSNLQKYREIYLIAKSEKALYSAFSGETRNIIRDFFNPEKKLVGQCQFLDCNKKDMDTVHLARDRPEIFMICASNNRVNEGDYFRYDIYNIMKCFLQEHAKPKSICFLCKFHHNNLHKLDNKKELNEYKRKIKT